jgi:hypothetical protein
MSIDEFVLICLQILYFGSLPAVFRSHLQVFNWPTVAEVIESFHHNCAVVNKEIFAFRAR